MQQSGIGRDTNMSIMLKTIRFIFFFLPEKKLFAHPRSGKWQEKTFYSFSV